MSEALAPANIYTEEDYYNLPENVRAELIDGQIYYMAAPTRVHQEILSYLHLEIGNYLRSRKGPCKVYPAPFAVKLFSEDDRNVVEPDISVICNPNKLTDRGCTGAPDWIVEITSPSNSRALRRICSLPISLCRAFSTSVMMVPTVNTGFKQLIGS